MGSILEKITLYDILGYLLSGCFLEIIICLEYILEKWISTDGMLMQQKEALEQFNSFFIVAFIVGGYCLGLILSEGSMLINKKLGYENKIPMKATSEEDMSSPQSIERMQNELLYLRQEVEFLKKIIISDNSRKKK